MSVSPEECARVYPQGVEEDFFGKLLAHEMAHRLHIRILSGDEDAMGPVWFFEGFAIYASGQFEKSTIELSPDEVWEIVEATERGSYEKYAFVFRNFLNILPLRELVSKAGDEDFTDWLKVSIMKIKTVFMSMFIISITLGGVIMAQEQDSVRLEMAAKVREIVERQGADSAIAYIEDSDDFKQVVNNYNNLMMDLYWKEKALHAAVPVIDAGIKYCLTKSDEIASEDSAMATKLKTFAKVFSANLASFTWPGWAEEGITITEDGLAAGLGAAKLNLQLVEELGADPAQMSNSHWSIGAHYLARNTSADFEKARESFEAALEYGKQAGNKDSELMNSGYIAMAKILSGEDAKTDFDEAVKALNDLGTDDAKFYAQQLENVLVVFSDE